MARHRKYDKDILYSTVEKTSERVKEKVEWSLSSHTEEEIRDKMLNDPDYVICTYVCRFSQMSEDFILEFMALSTGLVNAKNYSLELIDKVIKLFTNVDDARERANIVRYSDDFPESSKKVLKHNAGLYDRIDWDYIFKYQNLSDEFRDKYFKFCENTVGSNSKKDSVTSLV